VQTFGFSESFEVLIIIRGSGCTRIAGKHQGFNVFSRFNERDKNKAVLG
jgi:hypothetical protein